LSAHSTPRRTIHAHSSPALALLKPPSILFRLDGPAPCAAAARSSAALSSALCQSQCRSCCSGVTVRHTAMARQSVDAVCTQVTLHASTRTHTFRKKRREGNPRAQRESWHFSDALARCSLFLRPSACSDFVAISVGDFVYVLGGCTGNQTVTGSCPTITSHFTKYSIVRYSTDTEMER
jgi:hypothetical protein